MVYGEEWLLLARNRSDDRRGVVLRILAECNLCYGFYDQKKSNGRNDEETVLGDGKHKMERETNGNLMLWKKRGTKRPVPVNAFMNPAER